MYKYIYLIVNLDCFSMVHLKFFKRRRDDDVRFYCRYGITMMMIDMSKQFDKVCIH